LLVEMARGESVVLHPKVLLRIPEVAEALGCGRTYVYELIGSGALPAVKLGRLTRIPAGAVEELVARKLQEVGGE
jgi:excisionase family DNA binding protein